MPGRDEDPIAPWSGERALLTTRLTAQMLAGAPARGPEAVTERLLAVQAQDARAARLAIRARSRALSAADVDRALTVDRSLVISWLNRGTLHLVRSEDYPWLQALTTPPLHAANARRLTQEGVTPAAADRGVQAVARSLCEEGPLTRAQLRERIAAAGVQTEGQALVHVLMRACLLGVAVRGPMIGGQHAYALVQDWLDLPRPLPRETALAELARRYLAGHGPADDRDLGKWAGLPLREVRAGLRAIGSEIEERGGGLVDLQGRATSPDAPPRLLGSYDPVLLGWRSREPLLGPHARAVIAGGLFHPFALVRGRAAATWRLRAGEVVLEPFSRLTREESAALDADAADVLRFLEDRGPEGFSSL